MNTITVLGAGSWGTALAIHLAQNHQTVYLWGHDSQQIADMEKNRHNDRFLPNVIFPPQLHLQPDIKTALSLSSDILIAVPSHAFHETLLKIKPYLHKNTRLAWATKGLDPKTHRLLHELVKEIEGEIAMAVISGPSFAKEVAIGLPTAITVAASTPIFATDLVARLHSKTFRVYTTNDIIGVELGGAMKNVLAIAVGIADGLGFGANARSALITRGLAEMLRLGLALGAHQETLMGLAGVGDLVLTCTDNQSRNRRFGLALGQGATPAAAEKTISQVVEGINTSVAIHYLAKQQNIEIPICEQVYRVLHEGAKPIDAVNALLAREPRKEGI